MPQEHVARRGVSDTIAMRRREPDVVTAADPECGEGEPS